MKKAGDYTDEELNNLIANYRRLEKTGDPAFPGLLEEWGRRKGRGLDFDTTTRAVLAAAKDRRFLSYKELADKSCADWSSVHYAMTTHLGDLVEYAHRRGWPLLSSIVVNQKHRDTGEMEPQTLKGFVAAAQALGYSVTDEKAFLKEQQSRVFEWAEAFASE